MNQSIKSNVIEQLICFALLLPSQPPSPSRPIAALRRRGIINIYLFLLLVECVVDADAGSSRCEHALRRMLFK